jgi:hypothetical protein
MPHDGATMALSALNCYVYGRGDVSMSQDDHHQDALLETARLELGRAHRAAIALEAGEVRRGLELALAAFRSAGEVDGARYAPLASQIEAALADLDAGSLAEMERIVEAVRKEIEA